MNSAFWISDWNFFKLTIRYSWFLVFLFAVQISSGQVNTNGIVLHLDANNISSYSGSGNTWNDISGNNYHVNFFNGVQFRNTNETIPKYFEFNGTIDTRLVFTGSKTFTLADGTTLQDSDPTNFQL